MTQTPRQELHLFFSTESSDAVILFRASNSLYRLIHWQTKGDKFTFGQWIKTRIYGSDCALSPDGRHFLYGGMQKNSAYPFMAISRPPYFTALEYFPYQVTYSCGGFFVDNTTVSLLGAANDQGIEALRSGFKLDRSKKPWLHLRPRSEWEKTSEQEITRLRKMDGERRGRPSVLLNCYYCEGAKLFRKTADGNKLIGDFGDMQFENISAPYRGIEGSTVK
ncbi:hypothetical protein [Ruegeria faecimaris]|uniref:hypothetical protein n=1 Tax=Ruegeria faecimaris TaxID=686389 RepID=UPI002490A2E0|nr:hypothetical protein [Ruegeria faecimaris]